VTIHGKQALSATYPAEILDEPHTELFRKSSTCDRSNDGLRTRWSAVRIRPGAHLVNLAASEYLALSNIQDCVGGFARGAAAQSLGTYLSPETLRRRHGPMSMTPAQLALNISCLVRLDSVVRKPREQIPPKAAAVSLEQPNLTVPVQQVSANGSSRPVGAGDERQLFGTVIWDLSGHRSPWRRHRRQLVYSTNSLVFSSLAWKSSEFPQVPKMGKRIAYRTCCSVRDWVFNSNGNSRCSRELRRRHFDLSLGVANCSCVRGWRCGVRRHLSVRGNVAILEASSR